MRITFLFGSGADTDACLSLPSGNAFAETFISKKHRKEVKQLLNVDTAAFKMLYPTSSKMYIQTIYHHSKRGGQRFSKQRC